MIMKIDSQAIGNNFHSIGSFNAINNKINKKGRQKTEGRYDKMSIATDGIDSKKSTASIFCSFNSKKVLEYK